MSKLYIITGPAGVGKSTISKRIAKKSDKSVLLEGDEIYHQVVGGYVPAWKEGNHLKVFWDVCINTIKTYLENDYDVVFNYIVTPENLEDLRLAFSDFTIKFAVLMVDEETLLTRDSLRDEDCQMKDRCVILLNRFRDRNYNKNNILDTSNLTVEDSVNIILNDDRFVL